MNKTQVGQNKYGKYCVPILTPSRVEIDKILDGDVHEQDTIECIVNNSRGNDIVHAGTFFGDMLPAFSQAFNTVWAFEPSKFIYECASQTIQLNEITNVTLRNSALSNKVGHAYIKTANNEGKQTGSAARLTKQTDGVTERVDVHTIDYVVPITSTIDVIHLDVEGQELDALRGAKQTIVRCKPCIVLETRGPQYRQFSKFLGALGYVLQTRTHPTVKVPIGLNTVWKYNGE